MKEKRPDGIIIKLKTEKDEQCMIAGSNFCFVHCINWDICESITSPWKDDNENIHGNDTKE